MKTYIDAELLIVRTNNDIVTASTVQVGNPFTEKGGEADAPGRRRRGIWD